MRRSFAHAIGFSAPLALALLCAAPPSRAQAPTPEPPVTISSRRIVPPSVLSFDAGALLAGAVAIDYERALNPSVSVTLGPRVQFGPAVAVLGAEGSLLDSVGFGLGGRLGLRVYMTGFAPTGLYVSTEFTLLAQELQGLPGDWRLRVDAAMGIAYQHIVAGRFALSAGIAATLISSSPIVAQLVGPLRITVGFAF